MPVITYTLPQNTEPIDITTIRDVVEVLPEKLDYPLNVWIGGKLARYGQTSENLIFLVEQEDETSTELKLYFEKIVQPYVGTVSSNWKNEKLSAIRLYNEGRLIVDKKTLAFTELPIPTHTIPIITLHDVLAKLTPTVKWQQSIYLTGGLVRFGWSGNDVDIMTDTEDRLIFAEMRKYFTDLFGCKVDVGNTPMLDREPIYKFLLYKDGKCQL